MTKFASTSVKAFTSPQFNKGLLKIIQNKIDRKSPQIINELRRYLYSRIRYEIMNHPVIKSLNDEYAGNRDGSDLPAEYGLTRSKAQDGISLFEDKIVDPSNYDIKQGIGKTRNDSAFINISVEWLKKDYINELIYDSRAFYVSDKSGATIPWVYWMLSAYGEPVTSDDFGIIYPKSAESSRSGRAIMTEAIRGFTQRNGFPYEAPSILVSYNGKNWIEDTIGSKEFQQEIVSNLREIIKTNITGIRSTRAGT